MAIPVRGQQLVDHAIETIPSVDEIILTAFEEAPPRFKRRNWVGRNFHKAVYEMESRAFDLYKNTQTKALDELIRLWVRNNETRLRAELDRLMDRPLVEFVRIVAKRLAPLVEHFSFRTSQMRKARGGSSFEKILGIQLRKAGIPCESPYGSGRRTLRRIDCVVPDQDTGIERPDQAVFISCKRTLRERWKQTIPERGPNWTVYIVTSDTNLPLEKAEEINQLGMIVAVRDDLKRQPHLSGLAWVRPLSNLPGELRRFGQ